jgi:hypothetical protein
VPSDLLDNFAITSTFGSNIYYQPLSDNWIKLKPGTYKNMVISFADQNFNPLQALDPNVLISLLIRLPPKK